VLAAVRQAGTSRDERLREDAAGVAERLRTVAEKLEVFGPAQRASQLTVAAADADAFGVPGAGGAGAGGAGAGAALVLVVAALALEARLVPGSRMAGCWMRGIRWLRRGAG